MKVCIAEKPSVAKDIALILGATARMDGYYEGNGYQVTWTFGHLCTLKEPNDYFVEWKRWSLTYLPILPPKFGIKLIKNDGVEKQFNTIERLVNGAEEVINCGDAGQEGELIQRWVLAKANFKGDSKRLWISSLTEESIKEGFDNLKPAADYDNLYYAGSCRAIGDWLLGINATRLYTLKYAKDRQLLSIGRVQTPTLALIVNRQLEIDKFVSKTYWEIKTTYREVVFSAKLDKIFDKAKAEEIMATLGGQIFEVINFEKKKGKESPPKLFDLTSLQVECNKKFGYSADQTLKLIQGLYEKKLTTYPRVDTTYLSEDIYPKIPGIMSKLTDYSRFTEEILSTKIKKSKKVFDDKKVTDHHAIIPTGVKPGSITLDEKKVYDLIVRKFLAVFMDDCVFARTIVEGRVSETEFRATGKQILEQGWRKVYADNDKGSDDQLLPLFEKGESGPHEPVLEEKQTKPPSAFSEATLLRAMETAGKHVDDEELRDAMKENGIGRPSTRANIIETLFRRNYIRREKKKVLANEAGIQLIQIIQNEMLKSAELTGKWERKLRQIEQGAYDAQAFMAEMKTMVSDVVDNVKFSTENIKIGHVEPEKPVKAKKAAKEDSALKCPKCKNSEVVKGKSAYGCKNYGNGCDFVMAWQQGEKKLTDAQCKNLINKGKVKVTNVPVEGKKKDGVYSFDDAFRVVFAVEKNERTCPKCKQGLLLEGKAAYGCARWKEGCDFKLNFEIYGKKLTKAQLNKLIEKGKTGAIKGFSTPSGTTFNAALSFKDDFTLNFEKK